MLRVFEQFRGVLSLGMVYERLDKFLGEMYPKQCENLSVRESDASI